MSVRSRGTTRNAMQPITAKDISWADVVFVMEEKHRKQVFAEFRDALRFVPVHVLDIPDEYRFMDPELIELIRSAVESVLGEA